MTKEADARKNNFNVSEPILIKLGKQKRKRIKKLMNGGGKLWIEVQDVIDEATTMLGDEIEGKTIVPLILVYEKKPKRKRPRGFFG